MHLHLVLARGSLRATALLRRRCHFTRKRAELLTHIQNTASQYLLPTLGKIAYHGAKVYARKGPRVENFASDEEYRSRMIAEYNYSVSELAERRADRRSYACYPLLDENHEVLGLIYLDSNVPGTFTEDTANPRWQGLKAAAAAVQEAVLRA